MHTGEKSERAVRLFVYACVRVCKPVCACVCVCEKQMRVCGHMCKFTDNLLTWFGQVAG